MSLPELEITHLSRIDEIAPQRWDSVCGTAYPFICWDFLHALESSACVSAETGWQPYHLLVYAGEHLLALMPMYLKSHSQGEYVFDQSWASAYARHGLPYYPKLLTAIPFTPCEGPRLCFAHNLDESGIEKKQIVTALLKYFEQSAVRLGLSSWHCLFPEKQALPDFSHDDLLVREGVQFQWFNHRYKCFDDFLATLTSKHRKNIKRERRRVAEQGVSVRCLGGADVSDALWRQFFIFYQATYWKRGMPEYLNLAFFLELARRMPERLLLVIAEKNGDVLAAALSFIGDTTLYGRYWGCLEEYDRLHFEVCYYQGIDYCIEQGLACFNSGAQGEHKIARGFEPVTTYSLHWIAHEGFRQAIADFLQEESAYMHGYRQAARDYLPFNANTRP